MGLAASDEDKLAADSKTRLLVNQATPGSALEQGPAAYWPLAGDADQAPLEIPAANAPRLGKGDFSIAVWAQSEEASAMAPGDLLSQYEMARRRGFHLTLNSNAGVTTNQANWRHLQFGIDDDHATAWRDCGKPGNALCAFALATHEGALYAGVCQPGKAESGRVYRYVGDEQWIDCGAPDGSNAVIALAVFEGALYAGTGRYRVAGSSLPESENVTPGGRIFRYDGGTRWIDCGQLPDSEAVGGMVVFRSKLYASSFYNPAGFFCYDGGSRWTNCGTPDGNRVLAMTVHDGFLYVGSYDCGNVYRFDGENWTDCGLVGDNTQNYSFIAHQGKLLTATWRSGRVFRFDGIGQWTDLGRLGEELEVMGMLVHNGRLIGDTLPLAEVYSYEGGTEWKRLEQLNLTPDVRYRRAWTMAEHGGELFCSTLPSGHVFAYSAGSQTAWKHSLSSAWHHITAVKSAGRLTLFVNGEPVAESKPFDAAAYDLDSAAPLRIGSGVNGPFKGKMNDLRIYRRALSRAEIRQLAAMAPS